MFTYHSRLLSFPSASSALTSLIPPVDVLRLPVIPTVKALLMFIVPDVDKKVSPKPLQSVASVVETAVAALLVEWNEFCKSQLLCDALPFERIDILPVSFLRSEG